MVVLESGGGTLSTAGQVIDGRGVIGVSIVGHAKAFPHSETPSEVRKRTHYCYCF